MDQHRNNMSTICDRSQLGYDRSDRMRSQPLMVLVGVLLLFGFFIEIGGCGSGGGGTASSGGSMGELTGGSDTTPDTDDDRLITSSASAVTQPVDWIRGQFGAFGLVDSYQGDDKVQGYTYDQAMAVLAFSRAGLIDAAYFTDARRILSAMRSLQNPDGSWFFSYATPSGVALDDRKISGQMAWMVIALGHYQYWSGDTQYQDVLQKATDWILSRMDTDANHETFGGINFGEDRTHPVDSATVYSTEHNLDSYLACLWAGRETEALLIRDYLFREMWAPSPTSNGPRHDLNIFWTGYNDFSIYADPQMFANIMMGPTGPNGEPVHQALTFVDERIRSVKDFSASIQNIRGIAIQLNDLDTVWCEGTSQFELAARFAASVDNNFLALAEEAHEQIGRVIQPDGGVPFSFNESGSGAYPNDFRHSYVASAAWYYLNE